MARVDGTTPFEAAELKPCALCAKGVMHGASPIFYEVSITTCAIDHGAVRRLAGMEALMGGNVAIARALSPDTAIAHRISGAARQLVCLPCLMDAWDLAKLLEGASGDSGHG